MLRSLLFFACLILNLAIPKQGNAAEKQAAESWLQKAEVYLYQNTDSSLYYIEQGKLEAKASDTLMQARIAYLRGANLALLGKNDEAIRSILVADSLYKIMGQEKGQVECMLQLGEIYYNWAAYEKALRYFLDAFSLSKQKEYVYLEILSLNYMGKYHHSTGDYDKSEKYYLQAEQLAQEYNDTLGLMAIQNKLGKHYETLGSYPKALEYYLASEKLISQVHNRVELATTYNHLGNIYHLLKDYDKAVDFHSKALEQRKALGYMEGVAKSLNNLGEVLVDKREPDSAMSCFQESYAICKELNYRKGMIKAIQNEGEVNLQRKQVETAIENFRIALHLSEENNYHKGSVKALYLLAQIYAEKGDEERTEQYAERGHAISTEHGIRSSQRSFCLLLSELYENKQHFKQALAYYKEYKEIDSELVNLESNKRIAELENNYEISLKVRENEVLRRGNEIKTLQIKRKNATISSVLAIVFLLILLVIIVYGRYRQKQTVNKELQLLNEEVLTQKQEADVLNRKLNESIQQQVKLFSIISHELRNPLWWFRNLIQMLTAKIDTLDKDMISRSLHSLNESATNTFHLMDNLLHWSRSQLGNIQIKKEDLSVDQLINENVRLVHQFAEYKLITLKSKTKKDYTVYADKNMVQSILRNLIANAIKYTPAHGEIRIQTAKEGNYVAITVVDTGVGMDDKTLQNLFSNRDKVISQGISNETGYGLGLILCKEFVELNGGKLYVESRPERGSSFTFTLPRI